MNAIDKRLPAGFCAEINSAYRRDVRIRVNARILISPMADEDVNPPGKRIQLAKREETSA